jgi:hypothetical protein
MEVLLLYWLIRTEYSPTERTKVAYTAMVRAEGVGGKAHSLAMIRRAALHKETLRSLRPPSSGSWRYGSRTRCISTTHPPKENTKGAGNTTIWLGQILFSHSYTSMIFRRNNPGDAEPSKVSKTAQRAASNSLLTWMGYISFMRSSEKASGSSHGMSKWPNCILLL